MLDWGLVGQERAEGALTRALAEGRVAHSYVFAGPERVGKRSAALKLAQALNCEAPEAADRPCGECVPCRRIANGNHADVQTVTVEESEEEGEAHKGIHVSQVREIERTCALKPFEGRSRLVIIDPAEAMNPSAQNAFLKTLEEPPPQVVLVLVTADESRLLPTIRSRCRRLEFRLPSVAEIEGALAARGVEPERAALLARLSRGHAGWAFEAAADGAELERRGERIEGARAIAAMSTGERFALAERLAPEHRRRPEALAGELAAWRDWWRDVLLVQSGAEDGVTNVDMLDALRQDASATEPAAVSAFVRAVDAAPGLLRENAQPRLLLETLLLAAPRARARV